MQQKHDICRQCGAKCCRGIDYRTWYIRLTLRDIYRIARTLSLSLREFVEKYVVLIPQGVYAVPVLRAIEGVCVFLRDSTCTIHVVKPIACRVYPVIPPGDKLDMRCPLSRYPELLVEEREACRQYLQEMLETERLLQERRVQSVAQLAVIIEELLS